MDWIDRGLCVGQDPARWDVENLPEGREDEAAADLCADCPVMVACAKDAQRMVDNSHAYNRIVAEWNEIHADDPGFVRREEEPPFASYQVGVVRAGVAMMDLTCVEKLSAICGQRKTVDTLCSGCGRGLWRPSTPPEERPEGSVKYHARGMCWSCGYVATGAPDRTAVLHEVMALRREGLSSTEIGKKLGISRRVVLRRAARAKELGIGA